MSLKNGTKNQHFLSQAEQRLNASNPMSANGKEMRIFEFEFVDRESHRIKLRSKKGTPIRGALSLSDLFSFDLLSDGADRYNFEHLFQKYESGVKDVTLELLGKLKAPGADVTSEILNILTIKFMNFVRNPYSAKKVLNTFPHLRNLKPTDPVHLANFERVLAGSKPQQRYLCEILKISESDYVEWLGVIFLVLAPLAKNESNFLNSMIESLLGNQDYYLTVFIHTYENHSCLLSDRGFSTPLPEQDYLSFDFNLSSKSFIRYIFSDIDSAASGCLTDKQIKIFKATKKISAVHIHDDLPSLSIYNKHVVYQCYSKVFCSDSICFGLDES